ncbi:MAG: hypothetical protein JNK89_04945, partial [Saprospiraceae bacterium]|nr:hypothetical protein [Saprospiraceae bacterium]
MNWLHRWRAVWNPDMYHGWGREKRYFEGWYFKIVSADEQAALAIIPGISMDKRGNSHAFIQIMDGIAHTSKYYWFKPEAFTPAPTHFALQLDANHFSAEKIELDLPELLGKIQFENTTPWPSMLGAPGIMGWYSFVPFM